MKRLKKTKKRKNTEFLFNLYEQLEILSTDIEEQEKEDD